MEDKLLAEILAQMVRIADSLDIIARAGAPQEPNYIKPIGEFVGFDWASIGATVVNQDADGPTHLEWGGFIWTRRSPANKYAPAIWYSRASGKDEEGNNNYLKLITFKTINDADPIPGKVAAAIPPAQAKPPTTSSKPAVAPATSAAPGEKNGNGERPYAAQVVKEKLQTVSEELTKKSTRASLAQRNLLRMLLDQCFAGDNDAEKKRKTISFWLSGKESSQDISDGWVVAMLDRWLCPKPDSGGGYVANKYSILEAQAIYRQALLDAGQQEMAL